MNHSTGVIRRELTEMENTKTYYLKMLYFILYLYFFLLENSWNSIWHVHFCEKFRKRRKALSEGFEINFNWNPEPNQVDKFINRINRRMLQKNNKQKIMSCRIKKNVRWKFHSVSNIDTKKFNNIWKNNNFFFKFS